MVAFRLPEVEGLDNAVKGLSSDLATDVCRGFMDALQASYTLGYVGPKMTPRQREMAVKAGMFVAACAKVGIEALIDEATGAQTIAKNSHCRSNLMRISKRKCGSGKEPPRKNCGSNSGG